ncbi:hypothetical protein KM043_014971 [Ampulex compressa]|nr:hypothetical protein KM043_014971 [Ampulex compressa]
MHNLKSIKIPKWYSLSKPHQTLSNSSENFTTENATLSNRVLRRKPGWAEPGGTVRRGKPDATTWVRQAPSHLFNAPRFNNAGYLIHTHSYTTTCNSITPALCPRCTIRYIGVDPVSPVALLTPDRPARLRASCPTNIDTPTPRRALFRSDATLRLWLPAGSNLAPDKCEFATHREFGNNGANVWDELFETRDLLLRGRETEGTWEEFGGVTKNRLEGR